MVTYSAGGGCVEATTRSEQDLRDWPSGSETWEEADTTRGLD